jgi:predicted nucleotidyltransferase
MIRYQKIDFGIVKANMDNLKDVFRRFGDNISAAYIFGSLGSGDINPLSDIDLAVLFDENLNQHEMVALENKLRIGIAEVLHTDEIDIVILNMAPLSIQYGTLKNKMMIICENSGQMVKHFDNTVLKYLDILPYRTEMNRAFVNAVSLEM